MAERKRVRPQDEEQSQSDELGDAMGNMLEGIVGDLRDHITALELRIAELEAQPSASSIMAAAAESGDMSKLVAQFVSEMKAPECRKHRQGLWSWAQKAQNDTRGPLTKLFEGMGLGRPV